MTILSSEALHEKLEELPPLPAVVARMVSLDSTAEGYFEEVLRLLEQDPPFAARATRLANSVAMGANEPVTTLREALSRVGTTQVRNLIFCEAVTRVFVPANPEQRDLWIHSVEVATTARLLARLPGHGVVDPDVLYLGALLHDIGRFLMFRDSPEELGRVNETHWHSRDELVAAERALCGMDHAELGWRACHAWGLPAGICNVVRLHHAVATDGVRAGPLRAPPEVALIALADALCLRLSRDPGFAALPRERKLDRLDEVCAHHRSAGFTAAELVDLEPAIREESLAAARALGLAPR